MPSEDTNILEFRQYQKPDKAPFFISANLECLLERTDGWKNNPESLYITKISEHILYMSRISSFKSIENGMMYTEVKTVWKGFVNL